VQPLAPCCVPLLLRPRPTLCTQELGRLGGWQPLMPRFPAEGPPVGGGGVGLSGERAAAGVQQQQRQQPSQPQQHGTAAVTAHISITPQGGVASGKAGAALLSPQELQQQQQQQQQQQAGVDGVVSSARPVVGVAYSPRERMVLELLRGLRGGVL